MAKKTNSKKVPQRKDTEKIRKENSNTVAAMLIFLTGFFAEVWLMVIKRYFVNGSVDEMLSFYNVLQMSMYVGLAVLALGVVLTVVWRASGKRKIGLWLGVIGLFLSGGGWVCYAANPTGVNLMTAVVAVVTLLALAFLLYQREFVWSASILGVGVVSAYVCRKGVGNTLWNTQTIVGAVVVMVVLLGLLLVLRKAEHNSGCFGKLQLLPAGASYTVVYASIAATVVATAVSLLSATLAYYLMFALALCIFALVVYYTVKQL